MPPRLNLKKKYSWNSRLVIITQKTCFSSPILYMHIDLKKYNELFSSRWIKKRKKEIILYFNNTMKYPISSIFSLKEKLQSIGLGGFASRLSSAGVNSISEASTVDDNTLLEQGLKMLHINKVSFIYSLFSSLLLYICIVFRFLMIDLLFI